MYGGFHWESPTCFPPKEVPSYVFYTLALSDVTDKWLEQRSKEGHCLAKKACVSHAKSCLHLMQLGHLIEGEADDSYETLSKELREMVMLPEATFKLFTRPAPKPRRAGQGKLVLDTMLGRIRWPR
jgi:hypothetical protein